ncbi:MAG: GWxTD domain-containing protein [Bacteroidota bacterium]
MTILRIVKDIRFSVFIFFVYSCLIAQPTSDRERNPRGNLFEINILPVKDSVDCCISFNIPYNRLIFVKSGTSFSGGAQLYFDVKHNNKIFQRKSFSKKVLANSYEETQSKEKLLEGFVDFRLFSSEYVVCPSIRIDNTNQIVNLDSIVIKIPGLIKNNFVQPIVVRELEELHADYKMFHLVNRTNRIPFEPDNYKLLIPVQNNSLKEAAIKIEQLNKTVFNDTLPVKSIGQLKMFDRYDRIIISGDEGEESSKYLLIENFNKNLSEGTAELIINSGSTESRFNLSVVWIDKPITLSNINLAIELLEIIYDRSELLDLYKTSNQQKYNALFEFWDKKNPDRQYQYNNLMNEFYKRADSAMINFSNLANQIGAKTDRGKIYIQFGKPDDVKREYKSADSVVEIWYYKDLQKEFIFTDRTGLGNYILSK